MFLKKIKQGKPTHNFKIIFLTSQFILGSVHAASIGIMDTGTDFSHKELNPKVYINTKEKSGTVDVDGDGLPGNVMGWDYTKKSPIPFDPQYINMLTPKIKQFFALYAKYELGQMTETEKNEIKKLTQDPEFLNQANFIGSYAHGTHVSGIATEGIVQAKIMSLKILPTVYKPVPKESVVKKSNSQFKNKNSSTLTPLTMEDLVKGLQDEANNSIKELMAIHKLINFHKLDVVNQSFGTPFGAVVQSVYGIFVSQFDRKPTNDEMKVLLSAYYGTLQKNSAPLYGVAPKTLFVLAAGNDKFNNDQVPAFPGMAAKIVGINNTIIVAATFKNKKLADFSNFGAKMVDVGAPGVAIKGTSPAQSYLQFSGTSQAAPYVTNTAARMKNTNSNLTPFELKKIILETVDVKDWLKGVVKSSGVVNRARAVKAAELSLKYSITQSISEARKMVADIPEEDDQHGFFDSVTDLDGFVFNPIMPSMNINVDRLIKE